MKVIITMPINPNCDIDDSVRIFLPDLTNLYGCSIGADTTIGPFVEIQSNVVVGRNCAIQSHSFICSHIIIGDNVFVGHGVMFTNDRHPKAHNQDWIAESIIVENNVSIGSGAVILPGIRLGEGCQIGAGAVVTKDVLPNTIVIGNPAHILEKD